MRILACSRFMINKLAPRLVEIGLKVKGKV
jgi:hypothetical protein